MRKESVKLWYIYEAEKNNIGAILVYPGIKNPKKYIIDFRVSNPNTGVFFQYLYDPNNKPKEVTIKSVLSIINAVSLIQKSKPAVYFYEEKPNETTTNDESTIA